MSIIEIILIGIGLAMDCFAVCIAGAIAYGKADIARSLRIALFFGLFQGIMPLLGWLLGSGFAREVQSVDHWVAFVILGFIGAKMIVESTKECDCSRTPFGSMKMLLALSVATSIDAFATGLIFIGNEQILPAACIIIGICSALFSLGGIWIGLHFGKRFKLNVEMVGGIILIALGVKIMLEHTLA